MAETDTVTASSPTASPGRTSVPFDIAGALGAGYSAKEITDALVANPEMSPGFNFKAALEHYSPEEVVDYLNPKADRINVQGIPVLAPIDRGLAHLRASGANLADDLGFKSIAAHVRQSIPTALLATPTSGAALASDLRDGHYLRALSNLPSAALEQSVPVAGGLLAGVATGGSLPAVLGTGATIGAVTQGDDIARARAAANGRAAPSATDLALGMAGGAGVGAVGSIGLRGVATPGIGAAVGNTVRHAAADAAQPELASLAGSVGTDAGMQNASLSDMAAAGLTGAATRGALGVPGAVQGAREALQARTPEGQRAAFDALPGDAQQRAIDQTQAVKAMQAVRDGAVTGPVSDQVAATTAASLLADQVHTAARGLDAAGALPEGGAKELGHAIDAAASPSRALLREHLDGVEALGLDPETTGHLQGALRTINLLSSPDFLTTKAGPAETALGAVGSQAAGAALGSVIGGGPWGAVAGALAGQAVKGAGGRVAGALGRSIDNLTGLAPVSEVQKANAAASMIEAAGIPVPDTPAGLKAAMEGAQDSIATQRRLMDAEKAARAMNATLDGQQQARDALSHKLTLDAAHQDNAAFDASGKAAVKATLDDAYRTNAALDASADARDALSHRMTLDAAHADNAAFDTSAKAAMKATLDEAYRTNAGVDATAKAQDAAAQARDALSHCMTLDAAYAEDAARTRGTELLEREGGRVALMALRRAKAAEALKAPVGLPEVPSGSPGGVGAPGGSTVSTGLPGASKAIPVAVPDVLQQATARATQRNPLMALSATVPGMEGLSAAAKAQGALLPEWQFALGANLKDALHTAGTPKPINTAQEVAGALKSLLASGAFDTSFAYDLAMHQGRVTRGVFNLVRNEMLLRHGIDMRTLAAQQAAQ